MSSHFATRQTFCFRVRGRLDDFDDEVAVFLPAGPAALRLPLTVVGSAVGGS